MIAETRRLIPGKPIRYIVNTHHHFDHSGGLRTYIAQSATIVTHQDNIEFYRDVVFHPGARTLEPRRSCRARCPWFAGNRVPTYETVNQKYVLSDGVRTLDLYSLQGVGHAGTMLVAYLPTEKILINADLYSPPAPGAQPPTVNASLRSLRDNIRRLGLEVDGTLVSTVKSGRTRDFLRIVGES